MCCVPQKSMGATVIFLLTSISNKSTEWECQDENDKNENIGGIEKYLIEERQRFTTINIIYRYPFLFIHSLKNAD